MLIGVTERTISISLDDDREPVTGIATVPDQPDAAFLFAHGAGAGIHHEFMAGLTTAMAGQHIAVLRYNFPYMEDGRRAPDRQPLLLKTVRAAVEASMATFGELPLFAGGKSMGGRMTSLAHSKQSLPGVRGLIFLGFPLHAAGRPGVERAAHLASVLTPQLFVQGSRDRLADIDLIRDLVNRQLKDRAALIEVDSGDHSFKVPRRVGLTRDEVLSTVVPRIKDWMVHVLGTKT